LEGVTDFFDSLINQYDAISASVTILVITVIIVIIVLGLEFWRNFFGMLGSPAITFQRLIGEVSLPPAIFVVIVSGFLMAIALLLTWTNPVTGDAVKAQFNIFFDWISEQLVNAGGMLPEEIDVRAWFAHIEHDVVYLLGFFVLLPIGCLIFWLLGGVGFHLGSLFAGNKGGGTIGGLLAASAYPYLPSVLVVLFLIKYIYGGVFTTIFLILFLLYYVFLWVLLMREYGRFSYGKGFVGFIIGYIITAVLTLVLAIVILWIVALVMRYAM
jgi:hypothetical protein